MTDANAVVVRNNVREIFDRGETAIVLSVRLIRTVEVARIAKTAGFDCLYVDLEHSSISDDATGQICMAALDAGVAPFVRVRSGRAEHIVAALDGGALGIIVPQVRSADEAREVVAEALFAPEGRRSVSSALPQLQFRSVPAAVATPALNAATMVIPMIETTEALHDVDEIASVAGVTMLLVGANDLTSELGISGQYGNELARDAYRRVIAACRAHGIIAGIAGIAGNDELIRELIAEGMQFVSGGTDLGLLMRGATDRVRGIRGAA